MLAETEIQRDRGKGRNFIWPTNKRILDKALKKEFLYVSYIAHYTELQDTFSNSLTFTKEIIISVSDTESQFWLK